MGFLPILQGLLNLPLALLNVGVPGVFSQGPPCAQRPPQVSSTSLALCCSLPNQSGASEIWASDPDNCCVLLGSSLRCAESSPNPAYPKQNSFSTRLVSASLIPFLEAVSTRQPFMEARKSVISLLDLSPSSIHGVRGPVDFAM